MRKNILGYSVVIEALFQARQLALAERFEKKNEAHEFYSCSLCGEKCECPKSHPQHLKSQKQVFDPVGIRNCLFTDKKRGFFMEDFGYLDNLVRFFTFVGVQVWRDYTCLRCGRKCNHFKSCKAVKNEKVDEREHMLYTVDVSYEDEGKLGYLFDYTRGGRRRRNIGLATMQSRQSYVKMHALREMNRNGVEAMRAKIGTKTNNNIRKLPKKIGFHR
ncbi:cytoplasmic 60S subunit biogenesis factor REI1 homolog 2-like [Phalaenopsis equestris]|uniref:cytoplasmic 60S subunit biogenesis factor REI1 homolog 2-like n=1 Tax=Phalaenopsis equestris TaxID=78828 RepID=UPI0009E4C9D8|nr:cytoplasmic 60S subunit biogenesis factor REI1 homolog 2-like [Phalaenopsis equestris]